MSLLTIERDTQEVAGVKVRSLTAGEQIDLDAALKAAGDDVRKLLTMQLAAYVCDDSGKPALTAEEAGRFLDLRKTSTVKAIIEAAGKLNGWIDQEAIRGN
jgi:hypothetical protein